MEWFERSLPTPAENLALDEALIDFCEATSHPGLLRFWESPSYFVVVGYGNRLATEVNLSACQRDKIPVLRRVSGGGTVLQGSGCFNYALALPIASHPELASISSANCFIMKRTRDALAGLKLGPTQILGHTDLAIGERKFSGNAQRRKKEHLLFHGTFLLNFDLSLIAKYLRFPSAQPDYRRHRAHEEFVRNLETASDLVRECLIVAWGATAGREFPQLDQISSNLLASKYLHTEWHEKF